MFQALYILPAVTFDDVLTIPITTKYEKGISPQGVYRYILRDIV